MVLFVQLPTNFFSLKKDMDLKERTVQAMYNLETEIKAMHSLRNRLQKNVNDSLLEAVKSDEPTTHYLDEYDDLVKLLNIVKSAEMLLQNLSVKIDSTQYLQEFVNILDSAMRSVYTIKSDISRIVPVVDSTLDRINNSIMEMKTELKINEIARRSYELPVTMPHVNIELPVTIQSRTNIGAINLTTFTTAVHTQV
jgi:hypothetical protein